MTNVLFIKKCRVCKLFVSLLLIFSVNSPVEAQDSTGTYEAYAVYFEESPRIDGILDEPIWNSVTPITGFLQREPQEGAEPTERTEVKIAYDDDNLYFGMTMYDSEPSKIISTILQREGRIDQDDRIQIGLDTYHDKRNGYIFEINPFGTKGDALITDEGRQNWDWEGIYITSGRITDFGWVLEVAIPFTTIRFRKEEEPEMGVAIYRSIRRKNEEVFWPLIGRDYSSSIFQVSQYATLKGFRNIEPGRNIQVKPYALAGAQKVQSSGLSTSTTIDDIGLDVKYGITPNLTLDLTYNTDFAQVEEDNIQINLTRFNLFFPEKRDFFLERAGLFDFGDTRQTQTFFSRRIGISNDIIGGGRLTGQVGKVSLGLLNIQTGDTGVNPGFNNTVARVRTDLRPRTTVGGIVTNLQTDGTYNRAAGLDIAHRFLTSSSFNAWFTNVWDNEKRASTAAGSADLNINNDRYQFGLGYTSIGYNFNPGLGFVRRDDMVGYTGHAGFFPRIGNDLIRQLAFTLDYNYIEGQNGEKQSVGFMNAYEVRFESGDRIGFSFSRDYEVLYELFNIRGGVATIPVGTYRTVTGSLNYRTDQSRRLWGSATAHVGSDFGGDRTYFNTNANFKFSEHFALGNSTRHTILSLPYENGHFTTTVTGMTIFLAVNNSLFANTLVQYDNVSKDMRANFRLDWIHTPGSDLFLVFNTGYNFDDGFNFRNSSLLDRAGIVKLTYVFAM
ncbi:DUF5916 domain-containing protein [candidate division KSB1 bacterium]